MSCWYVTGHWSPFWIIWFISFNLCWPILINFWSSFTSTAMSTPGHPLSLWHVLCAYRMYIICLIIADRAWLYEVGVDDFGAACSPRYRKFEGSNLVEFGRFFSGRKNPEQKSSGTGFKMCLIFWEIRSCLLAICAIFTVSLSAKFVWISGSTLKGNKG